MARSKKVNDPAPLVDYEDDFPEFVDRDPTQEPTKHFVKGADGKAEIADGRRPSKMILVDTIRERVGEWRDNSYPGASATTLALFHHWFGGAAIVGGNPFTPYWGQREAVETLAYLLEVEQVTDAKALIDTFARVRTSTLLPEGIEHGTDMEGNRFVKLPTDSSVEQIPLPPEGLPRYAFKMATGSGKTFVMALVIVWSYFHAKQESDSPLSTNFVVLAPNVIVFDRLRLDFEHGKVFKDNGLVPLGWNLDLKVILRGESTEPGPSGNLFVTNIQQLYESESSAAPVNPVEALLGKKPVGNAAVQARSMLDRIRSLDSLLVLNDEAHHVHDDDLKWNQTLLDFHGRLQSGLSAWLDFTATPRFQGGAHFPWIVVDYPLAQAVEDKIVKAPVVLRLKDKKTADGVTDANVIEKYGDWLITGLTQLKAHENAYKDIPNTKPIMFVMCEKVKHADLIGEWLASKDSPVNLEPEEILVIHTKTDGEIAAKDLDDLRKKAREVDDPKNPVRVVVSVLVLREGWDVRNVTVVLGLRPGTAKAKILPEQAVGRGLRLMREVSPDRRQFLEVLGTPKFEEVIGELEAEGVYVPVTSKPPMPPIRIYPMRERMELDIAIPRTNELLVRRVKKIDEFDPLTLEPTFPDPATTKTPDITVVAGDAIYDIRLKEFTIERPANSPTAEFVAVIVNKVMALAGLTNEFATLYPLVTTYLTERCFTVPKDIESDDGVRKILADPMRQNEVAKKLARKIGEVTAEEQEVIIQPSPLRLSQTEPFLWRRQHEPMAKTIFNEVATWNPFERDFAKFLADKCDDVSRFAALAETFTRFRVEYLKPSGAIGLYYPDWVVVQTTVDGDVNWIVETKGRVWEGTEQKDAAIAHWCEQVTKASGETWNYMRVDQPAWKPMHFTCFADLVTTVAERAEAIQEPMLFRAP